MRRLIIVFVTLVLLALTTFAEKPNYTTKIYTKASVTLSEPLPISPTPYECACSCGKNCAGDCTTHFEGCGIAEGIRCILDCCSKTPNDCPDMQ